GRGKFVARGPDLQFLPHNAAQHNLSGRISMIETSPQISATPSQDRPVNSMLTVRDLIKTIDGQEILRGVDLEVAHGETLAIIGRSGGGKSVLLKHLVGLMQPDAGESQWWNEKARRSCAVNHSPAEVRAI